MIFLSFFHDILYKVFSIEIMPGASQIITAINEQKTNAKQATISTWNWLILIDCQNCSNLFRSPVSLVGVRGVGFLDFSVTS